MKNVSSYVLLDHDLLLDEGQELGRDYVLKIKDMPEADKPREKMLAEGPGFLSVTELVAVLLGSGTIKEEVMAMSARIVRDYGEKSLSAQVNPKKLSEDLDIPIGKAMQIVACAELGRRFFQKPEHGLTVIRNSKDVFDHLRDMRNLPKEHLRGLYLNTHHRLIHDEVISIGTINSNVVHPREIFKPAIEYGAAAVILAHNHPSGVTTPSAADIEITEHIVRVGKVVGIPLVDHVVIGPDSFESVKVNYEN